MQCCLHLLMRRGPQGPLSDEDLVAAIKDIIKTSPFTAEGYRKIWAQLRFRGIRTSKKRVRRLLREHNLLAPVRKGSPKGPRNHDGKITTEAPNIIWGTDMTTTILANGRQVSVFVAVDHHALYCVGLQQLNAVPAGRLWSLYDKELKNILVVSIKVWPLA